MPLSRPFRTLETIWGCFPRPCLTSKRSHRLAWGRRPQERSHQFFRHPSGMPQSSMATYISLNVHVVFATKARTPCIKSIWKPELHAYLAGTAKGLQTIPFAVGGTDDHVHMLLALRATHNVSDLVREIKKSSHSWAVERERNFAWQTGYGAFSAGTAELARLTRYIENQEEHHREMTSFDEMRRLLKEHNVAYDPQYFE
jgi:putative transposase